MAGLITVQKKGKNMKKFRFILVSLFCFVILISSGLLTCKENLGPALEFEIH